MNQGLDDTIVAVASPPGAAVRAIVRASGPDLEECLSRCLLGSLAPSGAGGAESVAIDVEMSLSGAVSRLPCRLLMWPAGRSYTGQTVAELHTIGSPPLVEAVVNELCRHGARLAQPGEFTLRAFLNGKLDLTQAEAVLGVIEADDPQALAVSLAQLAGGLTRPLEDLRAELLTLLADLEAGLDFVDEDIEFITADETARRIEVAAGHVRRLRGQLRGRASGGELPRVALVGPPNAGKSTLFNALTGGRAIVSPVPGTTRDYLVAECDIDGARCLLLDTAGTDHDQARQSEVDRAAQAATVQRASEADLLIVCIESGSDQVAPVAAMVNCDCVMVRTKADLASQARDEIAPDGAIAVCAPMGKGLRALRTALRSALVSLRRGGAVASTAARCGQSLDAAAESLGAALALARQCAGDELVSAEVRLALEQLAMVAGQVYTDDLLDSVFARFCVGK